MSDFSETLDSDIGGVQSHRYCETPVSGPGGANLLVTVTGVALCELNYDKLGGGASSVLIHGDVYIKTDYHLKDSDKTIPPIATYVSLASIGGDSDDSWTLAVDTVETTVATDNRVTVHAVVGIQGEGVVGSYVLHRISYQANLLIQRAGLGQIIIPPINIIQHGIANVTNG